MYHNGTIHTFGHTRANMHKFDGKILIVDDDQAVLYTARMVLKQMFAHISTESSPSQIIPLLRQTAYDVVVLDMNFAQGKTSGQEGLFWLREILNLDPQTQVIVTTAYGDIELAVSAMREGAIDFLVKPWEKEKLLATVHTAFQLSRTRREVAQLRRRQQTLSQELETPFAAMITRSPAMQPVLDAIQKVAETEANVLILGENGTGKELVARAIHCHSLRAAEAFIKIDLGAITETLFESELFGHTKGAFTGAVEDRAGRMEVASGGTLLLDEIGNLSLPLQAKLLTALQSKQVIPVGTHQPIDIDVRLVCATNQPLHELAAAPKPTFRQDLLYRINTVEIFLPPLRARREDISVLVAHFLRLYGKKYGKETLQISRKAMRQLEKYTWPGNVRELQHAVERAVIMSSHATLEAADFLLDHAQPTRLPDVETYHMETVEKNTLTEAIRKHQGNLSKAAQELGLGRSTLYRKMKKYDL